MSSQVITTKKFNFISKKRFNYFYCYDRDYASPQLFDLLENPDNYITNKILKEDVTFTTTVGLTKINNTSLVIKRYNIKNFTHGLKRALSPSRAARSWRYSHLLRSLNIKTPKPIAMIEKRLGVFRRQSYFITEYIDGPSGFDVFEHHPEISENNKQRADATIALIHQLHQHKIKHGDLKASNFIYHDNQAYIIDLDAMTHYSNSFCAKSKIEKDRKRFMENWVHSPIKHYFENF